MTRPLAIVGLAAFVAVDVVLVGAMMMKSSSNSVDTEEEGSPRSSTTAAAPTATSKPTTGAANLPKAPVIKPGATVLLSIARDETVVSATRRSCKDKQPGVMRISTNLGKKFFRRRSPVVQVLSLEARSAREVVLTGTDADCNVGTYTSADLGRTWAKVPTADTWHVGPSGVNKVISPSRTSKPGCDLLSISATDSSLARVSCQDGDILGTGTGGKSWDRLGHLDALRAAVFPAPGNGMALASFQGCAAQAFTTRDGGRTWSKAGCITGSKAQSIAFNGTTLVAFVSDQLYVSTNKGSTWSES